MFNREWKYLILILFVFIAACIETDIYLPAFTDMMAFFSISEEQIQSLLTWNFVGICLSGPFYGPISDSIGRKKPLLFALGLFLTGSIFTVLAESFHWMLAGRLLQGIGSGGCFTLGTAILFDAFPANKAMQAINKLNAIVPFIMAGAPLLGGYLNEGFGFRSNFIFIAFAVLFSLLVSLLWFEETLAPEKRRALDFKKILSEYKHITSHISFWQTTLIVSCVFSAYLVFLSGISVLFVIELGVSKQNLPYFQASLLGAWLVASLLFQKALRKWGALRLKMIGVTLIAIGGVFLVTAALLAPDNPYTATAPMVLFSFGVNWINGLYFPEGMERFPDSKGMTASLLTSSRLLVTSALVGLGSYLYDGTLAPIVGIITCVIVCMLVTIVLYEKKINEDLWLSNST